MQQSSGYFTAFTDAGLLEQQPGGEERVGWGGVVCVGGRTFVDGVR
jgi:hypothetical protein